MSFTGDPLAGHSLCGTTFESSDADCSTTKADVIDRSVFLVGLEQRGLLFVRRGRAGLPRKPESLQMATMTPS